MNIIAVAHFYIEHNRAGGEYFLHSILKELATVHDVTVLVTASAGEDTEIDGVKVRYRLNSGVNPPLADLYITHFQNTAAVVRAAHRNKKPVMLVVHNDRPATKHQVSNLQRQDYVIFNSEWVKKSMNTDARSLVHHPALDKDKVAKKTGNHITLINLTPAKGSNTFYEMARRFPDEKFLAVGGGYWQSTQVKESLPNVTWQENTPDMAGVYAKSKIVLMPSEYESFGMVAREAGASGIPVICTPTPGLKENLGDAGIYADYDDFDAYEREIRTLLDKTVYKKASEKIKKHVYVTEEHLSVLDFIGERHAN